MSGKKLVKFFVPTLFAAALIQGCGSGAVSSPPAVDSTPMAVSPPTADVFPDTPTTFTVTGGNQPFTTFSSNSAALPVPGAITGNAFTVVPSAVLVDTPVDLTVRDSRNASVVAKANIRPSTLINQITFTPLAPTGNGCGAGLCGGGDAQVIAKAVQNGVVLRNRPIRFDVFQGSYQIVVPGSGQLVSTLTVNTDELGEAVIRITASPGAPTQVATIQTTDTVSSMVRRYNFSIIQQISGNGVITTLPSGPITITGAKGAPGQAMGFCPADGLISFYLYGGTPPYTIASPLPNVVFLLQTTVATSGGGFTARVIDCGRTPLIITDSRGLAIETAAVEGVRGPAGDAIAAQTIAASPTALGLGCGQVATVTLTGNGTFTVNVVQVPASNSAFTAVPTRNDLPATLTITRTNSGTVTRATAAETITVNLVSGGGSVVPVNVTLTGGIAAGLPSHQCS